MVRCICGGDKFKTESHDYYCVSDQGVTEKANDAFTIAICQDCGVIRQADLPFADEAGYSAYYEKQYPPNKPEYQAKNYEHDRQIAVSRCDVYGIYSGSSECILDVGSGSGAFVDECRARGATAYGCEMATYAYSHDQNFIYRMRFEDVHFPVDYFDKVTCHDVLEHILDPVRFINEMHRVLKPGGSCIIDFPQFHEQAGAHHWKREHIWYFTIEQLIRIIEKAGFTISDTAKPIESKAVLTCIKQGQDRVKILLPPGIGDSFWSIVKMESFLNREGLGIPDVYIACPREKKYQGHKRAFPFLEMFPFVHSTGEVCETNEDPASKHIWKEAYMQAGRTIFKNVLGYDYFISYNGYLRVGKQLEKVDPDLKCNWFPPMFVSLEQEKYRAECVRKYGRYIVFYFPLYGTYKFWLEEFPINPMIAYIKSVISMTGCTPVFTGALWDADEPYIRKIKNHIPGCVDLAGKTTVQQLFGLIKGAQMVVGYPSGLTIISTVLRQKTLIIWNDYYNTDFAWYSCPPETRGTNYFIDFTRGITPDFLAKRTAGLIEGKEDIGPHKISSRINLPEPMPEPVKVQQEKPHVIIEKPIIPAPPMPKPDQTIAIVCVLKGGGPYNSVYVDHLRDGVEKHITIKHRFIVLSDVMTKNSGYEVIPLIHKWPGWWSKMELFRPDILKDTKVIYFDLDTIIVNNIDRLVRYPHRFTLLRPFNPRRYQSWTTGIMAWGEDVSYIYNKFVAQFGNNPPADTEGDRKYIIDYCNRQPEYVNDIQPGIYSYKWHCKSKRPKDSTIICFHGNPRPHEVKWRV